MAHKDSIQHPEPAGQSPPLSYFRSVTSPQPFRTSSLRDALDDIHGDTYRDLILELRDILVTKGEKVYKQAKTQMLPAYTFGGTFTHRGNKHLIRHSGIIHADIDNLDDATGIRARLMDDPHLLFCFVSPSEHGLKLGVWVNPVEDDAAYKKAWHQVAAYFQTRYQLTFDPSRKDISGLCFVSWDPHLYYNPEAIRFYLDDRRDWYAEHAIKTAVEIIDASRPGNRHDARIRASNLLGGYVGGGIVGYDIAYIALEEAVRRNTDDFDRSMRTISDGLDHGQGRPFSLEQLEAEREVWRRAHQSNGHRPESHTAEVRDDEPEKSPPSHQPSPKVFFRKKTFIPKRLGDYLLTQHSIKYAAGLLWVYRSGVYSSEGERILAATAQQLLGEERRQNRIEEALRYIEVAAYAEMPPPDLRFINLLNGRLEWATDTLHPHTPDVFTVIQLPVRFDQTATCPTFDYYLDTTLDADVILLVEEVIGHLLIPDTRYEKAVMLTGDGGNGKSVFIDMLTALLGPQHVSNVALQDLEENRFRVAELFGKLGNFFADLDPRALKSSSLFKILVTGDEIEAERKFRDPFKFRNVARLVFSANKLPDSSDRTHAFYRRWHVIPFTRTFTGDNRDPDLRAKLVCELPGILNRALTGLKRLSAQKAFTVPQAVKEALNNYERQNDTLAAFLEEAVDMGPKLSVTKQRFYQRYCRWCDLYRLRPISQKELSPRLYKLVPDLDEARLDVRGVRGNKGPWRWIGIQPIDDGSEADEG